MPLNPWEGPPPDAQAWGPEPTDLDEAYARRIFFGKSKEEAFFLFEKNVIERASELRFMPRDCFRYYMCAFKDYLLLPSTLKNEMAPDAASCFIGLVQEKIQVDQESILLLMPQLWPVLRYIAENQDLYDADRDIYGDFRDKLLEIEKSLLTSND